MKLTTAGLGTVGLGGLVAVGLLSFPVASNAADNAGDVFAKPDDDAPALVTVDEDDDGDPTATNTGKNTHTNPATNTQATNTQATNTQAGDQTATQAGDQTDDQASRLQDWTNTQDPSRDQTTR